MRFLSSSQATRGRNGPAVPPATDYLRGQGPMAALMPAVQRMMALQADCARALPAMFSKCDIVGFDEGQLVLATPNAAVAAKLKQQLPKLQAELHKKGWQVQQIRLKVLVTKSLAPVVQMRALSLPERAVDAMAELSEALPASAQNKDLIAALKNLVRRRRQA